MTRITRVEVITNTGGREYVNWEDDNDVSVSYQDDGRTLKVFVNKVNPPEPKTLFDVIRNLGYSVDCSWEIVDAVEAFQKSKEWKPKSQEPEEVAEGLSTAFREAVKQGVVSSVDKPKDDFDALMEDPPSFLRFELGSTLEDRIYKWWETCFVQHPEWSMEECISDLCDRIFLWLPKEQNSEGTQRIETIVAVDTHNELLRKIKSKIHNKKV